MPQALRLDMFKAIPDEVVDLVESARLAPVPDGEISEYIRQYNIEAEAGEPKMVQRIARQNLGASKHDFSNLSADLYDNGGVLVRYGTERTEGVKELNPMEPIDKQMWDLRARLEREYGAQFMDAGIEM